MVKIEELIGEESFINNINIRTTTNSILRVRVSPNKGRTSETPIVLRISRALLFKITLLKYSKFQQKNRN